MSRRRDHSPILAFVAGIAAVALLPAAAIAQQAFNAQASRVHAPGAGEQNAAEALLKAMAAMDAPPASIPSTPEALLILPGDDGWDEAEAWATAPNQRAALQVLRDVTNPSNPHAFSLPYGAENTPPAIMNTGLAVELGDPPLIVSGDFTYIIALDELFALASIDATRLAEAGDAEAAYRMIQWIRCARMVADQPLSNEKGWAIHAMRLGVMRLLDLFALHPDLMTEREIIRLVRELTEDEIRVERILPPYADRIAMQQLVAATYTERAGPNPSTFGPVLASIVSEGQPLGLFGEASYFQRVAEQQANWFDTTEKVEAIYNDWERRWSVPNYDYIWTQQMERRLIDPARFTLIEFFSPDLYPIIQDRLNLRADLAGARMALSIIGYRQGKGVWASDLAAIRPTFVDNIDYDPFHDGGDRTIKQFEILEYFVPIRDQKFGPRENPHPHRITVFRAGSIFEGLETSEVTFDTALIDDTIDQIVHTVTAGGSRSGAQTAFTQFAEQFNDLGLTRANYRQRVARSDNKQIMTFLSPLDSASGSKELIAAAGLPVSELTEEDKQDLVIELLRGLFDDPDFTAALGIVSRDGRLDQETATGAISALLRSSAHAMMNLTRKLQPSAFGPDSFEVELDQDNFIMYARGIDRRADWAREVGVDAQDYLIWPPVLSLLRSELREEEPMAAWSE